MAMRVQYEDFDPEFDENEEPTAYVIHVYLPDFLKQQLKVTYDDGTKKMRARGERPLGNHMWSRFDKEFSIPDNCLVSQIRGKFEKNVLIITMPKKVITLVPPKPPAAPQPQQTSKPKQEEFPTPMPQYQKRDSSAEKEREKKAVSPPKPSSRRTHKRAEEERGVEPESGGKDPWNKEKDKSGGYASAHEGAQDMVRSAKEVMGKLGKRVKEDERSLINAGVAAVVMVALGVYIGYTLASRESKN